MSTGRHVSLYLTLFALLFGMPSSVTALDPECGDGCEYCGGDEWEGYWIPDQGEENVIQGCAFGQNGCQPCLRTLSEDLPDGAEIREVLRRATSVRDIKRALERYGDRILFHPERNLLVVRGSACNPRAMSSVVFLTRESAAIVAQTDLTLLSTFVAEATAQ